MVELTSTYIYIYCMAGTPKYIQYTMRRHLRHNDCRENRQSSVLYIGTLRKYYIIKPLRIIIAVVHSQVKRTTHVPHIQVPYYNSIIYYSIILYIRNFGSYSVYIHNIYIYLILHGALSSFLTGRCIYIGTLRRVVPIIRLCNARPKIRLIKHLQNNFKPCFQSPRHLETLIFHTQTREYRISERFVSLSDEYFAESRADKFSRRRTVRRYPCE